MSGREYRISILVTGSDQGASSMLGGLLGTLGRFASVAGGILGGAVLYKLGQGVFDMGRQALDATASWERMNLTIESLVAREIRATNSTLSMTEALALAVPRTRELTGWIQQLAINSPFDIEGVMTTYRQALAFGFTSDEGQQLTQVLVDMSSGMGLSTDKMQLVSYALGQINQSGRLLTQDLRQLMSAGVPVIDILDQMGYSLEDVGKKAISSQEFLDVFLQTMGEDFEGAAKRQATSWAGLMNTFADLKKMGLREFFGGLFDVVQPLAVQFSEWFQEEGLERIRGWGVELGNFTQRVLDFGRSLEGASPQEIIDNLLSGWGNLTDTISTAIDDINWGTVSQSLIDGINSIDWQGNSEKFVTGLSKLATSLQTAAGEVEWGELGLTIGDAIMETISGAMTDPYTGEQGIDWQGVKDTWQENVENFPGWAELGTYVGGEISRGLNEAMTTTNQSGQATGDAIGMWFDRLMATVQDGAGELSQNVNTSFIGLRAIAETQLGILKNQLGVKFNEIIASMKATGAEIAGQIADGIISGMALIRSAVLRIIGQIQALLNSAGFTVGIAVNTGTTAGAGGNSSSLGGGGGGRRTTTGNQGPYAGGGILSGPLSGFQTNAMFHGTEAVVPLEGGAIPVAMRGGGGGGGIFINFTYAPAVSMATAYEARDVLAPMLADAIRTELSKRGSA